MAYMLPTDWELKDFYREHADSLYRSCMFLTGGKADPQAMMKEILLKMLNRGIHFSSSADAKAWLILCAYKMRKKAVKAAASGQAQIIQEEPSLEAEAVGAEVTVEENSSAQEAEAVAAEVIVEENPTTDEPEEVPSEPEADAPESEPEEQAPISEYPELLLKLSAKDRLVALLYYCEGYRKTEIGKYLGCPTFAVRFRLARIRRRLGGGKGGE